MKRLTWFWCCVMVGLGGCHTNEAPNSDRGKDLSRRALISDQVHGGGTFGFFFLPPMVPQPTLAGTFDPTQSPTVRIDELDPASPGTAHTIATYTMTSGPGSQTIRADTTAGNYVVNWQTSNFTLSTTKIYRVNVLLGTRALGFADVEKVNGSELKNVDTNQYVPLTNGALPIKFFLNQCGSVVCQALDACHVAGSCDLATATCTNPAAPDGTACSDGSACTTKDECRAGACVGTNPVVCTAQDQCHAAGACDPGTGACSNPALADSTPCNDGNLCTQSDTCQTGACVGANPVVCTAVDACHQPGTCQAQSGTCDAPYIAGCRILRGIVAGSLFSPASGTVRASSAPSDYAGAKVCIDENGDFACNDGETSTTSDGSGAFELHGVQQGALLAEISTSARNGGQVVSERLSLRAVAEQVAASFQNSTENPRETYFVVVSPLSSEVGRMMEDDALDFATARSHLAIRLGVSADDVLRDPATVSAAAAQALANESTVLTNRFGLAAKMVDRGDVSPAALALNPAATGPAISMTEAHQAVMKLEGIPRYDHIFVIVLENRDATSIVNNAFAPKINAYLASGNHFRSYYSTGNPSEPNRLAVAAGDDFGITDDNGWNCVDTTANSPEEPLPAGLPSCTIGGTNHNIKNRPNLLTAMTASGMRWRVYSESMNPGRDPRLNGAADTTLTAPDHVYSGSPTGTIGNANLMLTFSAQLYATKHNESVNFQSVRSAPDFFDGNRTLGGGQWDAAIMASPSTPPGWNVDQFGSDLASGDLANLNYLEPDQCDDMHGTTVTGPSSAPGHCSVAVGTLCTTNANCPTGQTCIRTASDCSGNALIYRSDLYTGALIERIKASPVWTNPYKRVAIVISFDEGTVTTGNNACCGWNPGGKSSGILIRNPDGSTGLDTSVLNYKNGNKGHGYSVYGVLTNQAAAPRGLYDSDAYSHIAFVRTMQDMFGLADPGDNWSYMNRSKYTETFVAANILFLPEYAGSADPHFDAVRPMNHAYVIPAGYLQKNGYPTSSNKQVGPDPNQTNLWAQKP